MPLAKEAAWPRSPSETGSCLRLAAPAAACSTRSASSPTGCCRRRSTRRRRRTNCRATSPSGWRARRPRRRRRAEGARRGFDGALILAADTVVGLGRRCLPKAELIEEAATCLRLLSGRSTASTPASAWSPPRGSIRQRLVETRVRFKRLSREDMESLSRLRRMARQGRRLCHPGLCRRLCRQAGRLLHQRRRPAALRDDGAARRRGLSGPFQLAERGLSR